MMIHQFTSKVRPAVEQEVTEDRDQRLVTFQAKVEELADSVVGQVDEQEDFAGFERWTWNKLMEVGLAAMELFLVSKRQAPDKLKRKDVQGRTYEYVKEKRYDLRSMFGEGSYFSSQYWRGHRRGKDRELRVLDGQVGLLPCGGLSPNVALEAVELSTRMPYEHVREVLRRFVGYCPSGRSLCGLIDLLGPLAGVQLGEMTCAEGDVYVVQVDGRGIPRIRPEEYAKRCRPHQKRGKGEHSAGRKRKRNRGRKARRTKGKKAKNKKQVTVGILYSLRRLEDGTLQGPAGKLYTARFRDTEGVFRQLKQALDRVNVEGRQVVFISDGALGYIPLRQQYFPQATAVVDFYHVCEYLWKAGETVYAEGSKELVTFVKKLKGLLLDGEVEKVLRILRRKYREIPKRGPGTKGRRKRMSSAINYLKKRVDQMPYKEMLEQGIEIGSGAIESAIRQVVAIRFDGPGMKWGSDRPQKLLNLLCLRISGGWHDFKQRLCRWSRRPHAAFRMTPEGVNEKKKRKRPNIVETEEKLALVA